MYESHFLEISFVHLMIGLDFFFINENTAAKATNIFKKFKQEIFSMIFKRARKRCSVVLKLP